MLGSRHVHTRMRAAHRGVRGESPFPARAVRAVRAVGQDGLAIRTGQLRSIRPRLTRSWSGSRLRHESLDSALRGWRLAAPRVTDRPRLIGWCSLHLTRPDLRHPSSSSRAPPHRFQDRPEASGAGLSASAPVHPRDRDRRPVAPCGSTVPRSGCLPSCREEPDFSDSRIRVRFPVRKLGTRFAHRSHLEAAAPRVSANAECSSASAVPPDWPFGSPDGSDARCVGPTSAISPLRTRTRASPAPDPSIACAIACTGTLPDFTSGQARFGGSAREPRSGIVAAGVVFPS